MTKEEEVPLGTEDDLRIKTGILAGPQPIRAGIAKVGKIMGDHRRDQAVATHAV